LTRPSTSRIIQVTFYALSISLLDNNVTKNPLEMVSMSAVQRVAILDGVDVRIVLGSTTAPGRLHRAVEEAIARAEGRGTSADLLDLGTQRIGFADGTPPEETGDDTGAAIGALESARAVVLATPVYRGSMTGSLKNLLDLTPVSTLQGKVVGLVAMGASDHHFVGAERHLRDVLAFFGAVVMPVAVYLTNKDFTDGVPGERAEVALDQLLVATVATATALDRVESLREPPPLAAQAIKPRRPAAK
jgi:FMN reductase